ncbi:MAG TPA: hypothetical protein VK734_20555 [Bradyrhizobium sp.]|jgi:hypothetical protein|nr:hypothetical protein [Bradyrhizobium sp.]
MSSGISENSAKMPADVTVATSTAAAGKLAKKPRRPGAASAAITIAPAYSAPAPKPCMTRSATRRMGAQMPACA